MSEARPSAIGEVASSSGGTSRGLLQRAREHDPGAWERMVALYAPLVLYWCRQWGLGEDDAADVFQDVFQSVAAHIAGFRRDSSGGTFRGWLRTITRNKVNDVFRRRLREPPGVGGSEAQTALAQLPEPASLDEDGSADVAVSALMRRALELIRCEFETRTWHAFWLTVVESRAPKDVAAELGMSDGAVRVAKSRVLHRLRVELGDCGK
ncbi:MAG: sigma-70 family RNA polymerase sigma factor [Planctomycetia bacterium]|nr:sigma-70 family RNA polymerase sigma factor [Planctomycetia bacterium]